MDRFTLVTTRASCHRRRRAIVFLTKQRACSCFCLFLVTALAIVCTCNAFTKNPTPTTSEKYIVRQRYARRCRGRFPATPISSGSSESVPDNLLQQLQRHTTIWADTADVETVRRFRSTAGIEDVTTNPSIVSATARQFLAKGGSLSDQVENPVISVLARPERIAVDLASQLLRTVAGRVCTQLDVRCEDSGQMVAKAHDIVGMYAALGVASERVLIKTPATWAGLRATQQLEEEGIRCLVTLVCSDVQGRAAAEAGATMIATYVGRVSDWHKNRSVWTAPPAPANQDPGVVMTNALQDFFRDRNLPTEVMAASFRSVEQVAALAGCDHMTVAPALIDKLMEHPPIDSLSLSGSRLLKEALHVRQPIDEGAFTASLAEDLCGTDVLRASVDGFAKDTNALEAEIARLQHSP